MVPGAAVQTQMIVIPAAAGELVQIECAWVGLPRARDVPVLVFLHEGLGSVAMWRDFPHTLCLRCGFSGLVYSRPGYGRSSPRPTSSAWGPDFMHRQACEVLPVLLRAVGLVDASGANPVAVVLFGHSDGGSIALIAAARRVWPIRGVIVLAPHILVEDISVQSIAAARQHYRHGELRARLAKFHDDVDSAFYGWNDVWLSPAFRSWNLYSELADLRVPTLAVQGLQDQYGSLEQIRGIARVASQAKVQLLELADCGHSAHRDQEQRVIDAVVTFVRGLE